MPGRTKIQRESESALTPKQIYREAKKRVGRCKDFFFSAVKLGRKSRARFLFG